MLHRIFNRQFELTSQFTDIEQTNGLLPGNKAVNLDLQLKGSQYQCKHTAWCYVEELVEALMEKHASDKQLEELVDALHFLVELCLFCGYHSCDFEKVYDVAKVHCLSEKLDPDDVRNYSLNSVIQLGQAMHELTNRAWKKQDVEFTEAQQEKLYQHLRLTWYFFLLTWKSTGSSIEGLEAWYFDKAAVNDARIEAGA